MTKAKGLGRGLDALLTGGDADSETLRQLDIGRLQPGKYQPRTRMDESALNELAQSIKNQGMMQPIVVRASGGHYEIIAGERRWRAAKLAGLTRVPALVRDIPDSQALAWSLIENIQREDLSALEEAKGLTRLINEFSMTHDQVAQAIGRSRSAVTNLLRLLNLAPAVQDLLQTNAIDMGHARALLSLSQAKQIDLARRIVKNHLSVREAERLSAQAPPTPKKKTKLDRDILRLQEELSEKLGATVTLRHGKKGKGQLVIRYASLDELEGLLAKF